jgi:uncharacterized membrane protein YoaK (UPF0700 family)
VAILATVSGDGQARHAVPLIGLAAGLAFASGATDLASFTRLGGVFASVMTGNLVLLGLAVARASGVLAAHVGVSFAGYIAGAAIGSKVGARSGSEDEAWPAAATTTLVIEIAVFAVFTAGWELAGAHPAGPWQLCLLGAAALAMGLQSAATRSVRTPLSTTYLTGTLTGAVAEIVTAGRRGKGISLSVTVLAAAVAGAAAGGGVLAVLPAALPVLPMGAVTVVVTLALTRHGR